MVTDRFVGNGYPILVENCSGGGDLIIGINSMTRDYQSSEFDGP